MVRYLWMRLVVGISISEAEEAVIFANDGRAERLLQKIIAEGRFVPDGDTYIPELTVEEYNQEYGTEYETGDIEFCL